MRIFAVFVFVLQLATARRVEANNSFADLPFPPDVSFGMSSADLQKARPSVKLREGLGGIGMFGAVESIPEENGVIARYVYHFKGGKLGAITYNRTSTNMLTDVATRHVYRKLLASGGAATTMHTARAGQVFTVKRWKDAESGVELCLEATTRSTTITFVSADYFAVEELFPSVTEKDQQATILGKQERSPGRPENQHNCSIDRLSSDAPPHALLIGE